MKVYHIEDDLSISSVNFSVFFCEKSGISANQVCIGLQMYTKQRKTIDFSLPMQYNPYN